jgi:glucose/arabinose dehydrogenase
MGTLAALAPLALGATLAGCGASRPAGSALGASTSATSARPATVRLAGKRVRFTTARLRVPGANAQRPFDLPHALKLPEGWRAEVWARVLGARFALWTPEHTLLISASEAGRLYELTPGRKRSSPPRRRVLVSGLNEPEGMAFDVVGGRRFLYLAEADQVDRFAWLSGGRVGRREVIKANLPDLGPPGEDTHSLKGLAIGPDHTVYFSIGSVSNANPPTSAEQRSPTPRASIMAMAPNGGHMRVVMRGVRNGEGLAVAPDGSLWTAVNERDEIPYPFHRSYGGQAEAFGKVVTSYVDEHPPDELAKVIAGSTLGWPYCNPDPDDHPGEPEKGLHYANLRFVPDAVTNPRERVLKCARLRRLDRGLPAHTAPLGLTFLEGSAVGAPWSSGATLAGHGSWDRTPPRPSAVLWLPWEPAGHTLGSPIALVSGFQSGVRWGRPVDAVPGPEGDLYVTDDLAGAVYRIGPAGR